MITAVIICLLQKRTSFGKTDKKINQPVIGLAFGAAAVICTLLGYEEMPVIINCRDAAVLTAGLMFGPSAGIIAGIIGAAVRYVSAFWGLGYFTRTAAVVSTLSTGLFGAFLGRIMFNGKRPSAPGSIAAAFVAGIFNLTMIFLSNMNSMEQAYVYVKGIIIPLLAANCISVLLAVLAVSALSGEKKKRKKEKPKISQTIQRRFFATVAIAFLLTSFFAFSIQNRISTHQLEQTLWLSVSGVLEDYNQALEKNRADDISMLAGNSYIGSSGYVAIFDDDYNIISIPEGMPVTPDDLSAAEVKEHEVDGFFKAFIRGQEYFCLFENIDNNYIFACISKSEALNERNVVVLVNCFLEILVFSALFILIYLINKKTVVNQIQKINASLSKITDGNLDEVVNVRSNLEFDMLSDDINSTVDTLKGYIQEASARIDKELELAKNIQSSALPNKFPAFPKRSDFDIFASMTPAKEVGGDFYDFYFSGSDVLNLLIADVSGKGIPAAMFMMRAKTELKRLTEAGYKVNEAFTAGNNELCAGNEAGMFVTAWQGSIDLSDGKIKYANAGHNPPLIKKQGGKFEYLKCRPGFVLAGMEDINYKEAELKLEPGDVIFLYTDGVTEAMNENKELYGESRLADKLNSIKYKDMRELCEAVKRDVDLFAGETAQFDDITMLAFAYFGNNSQTLRFDKAKLEDIAAATDFAEARLKQNNCSEKAVKSIDVAIDEIFSNIVKFAYEGEPGPVEVSLSVDDGNAVLSFTDCGVPFNPLTDNEPDISLDADERSPGGLGILIVKKTMDCVDYRRENGKNILSITKKI